MEARAQVHDKDHFRVTLTFEVNVSEKTAELLDVQPRSCRRLPGCKCDACFVERDLRRKGYAYDFLEFKANLEDKALTLQSGTLVLDGTAWLLGYEAFGDVSIRSGTTLTHFDADSIQWLDAET